MHGGKLQYDTLIMIYDTVVNKEIPQFNSEYIEAYEEALNMLQYQEGNIK
jgi:hypothetical protein